jgi:hypothetical protein
MIDKNFIEIKKANFEHLEGIAQIEEFLWDDNILKRIEKLKWKSRNLNMDFVGAVAFLNDELVGYRGIMFSKINLNGLIIKLLHFTDAVVHEKARGLSILKKMNDYILDEYKNEFDFSYIYFPNNVSGHIYRSQGHYDFQNILFFKRSIVLPFTFENINFKQLTESLKIKKVIDKWYSQSGKFKIIIDEDFINWKISEPEKKYKFYVSELSDEIFIWIEVKKRSIEIQMLNYNKLEECLNLAKMVARKTNKWIVNIPVLEFQNRELSKIFTHKGFYNWEILNFIRKKTTSYRSILSRKLDYDLSTEKEDAFQDQSNWEYHNITFV